MKYYVLGAKILPKKGVDVVKAVKNVPDLIGKVRGERTLFSRINSKIPSVNPKLKPR